MARAAVVLVLVLVLAGCAAIRDRSALSAADLGLPYRAGVQRSGDPLEVTVVARARGAGLAEARESLRYPATVHCLYRTGMGAVDWEIDPATGDWAVTRTAGGDLVARGRCAGRR